MLQRLLIAVFSLFVCVSASTAENAASYDFRAQIPGGLLSVGLNSVVMVPCPLGVNGAGQKHYLYISGGIGMPELALIVGGNCTSSAASGTLILDIANQHSGIWTVRSSTAGIQEQLSAGNYEVILAAANPLNGPVHIPAGSMGKQYRISGISRNRSIVTVASDFPAVSGVFIAAPGEPGPIFEEFTVAFTQPDSGAIATYTRFPPAFYLQAVGRFKIRDVSIHLAWDGIDARRNAGGSVIDGLWMSAFGKGIQLDGAYDTTRIDNLHFWPFGGVTANQLAVFLYDVGPLGLEIGRADDVKLSNSLFINQRAIRMHAGDGFGGGLVVTNTSFDTSANIRIEAGTFNATNSYFSQGAASLEAITVTGGVVNVANSFFFNSSGLTIGRPQRSIYAPLTSHAEIILTGNRFQRAVPDETHPPMIEVVGAANVGAMVTIADSQFFMPAPAWENPIISINNAIGSVRLSFQGNRISDQHGTTKFLKIVADDHHYIWGNAFVGSTSDYPSRKWFGIYQDAAMVSFPQQLIMQFTRVYANNAEARQGGLTVGSTYRTATGVLMQVY